MKFLSADFSLSQYLLAEVGLCHQVMGDLFPLGNAPVLFAGTEPLVLGRSKGMKGVTSFLFPTEESVVLALS